MPAKTAPCLISVALLLSGCEWTGRQTTAVNEYVNGLSNSCAHWQCVNFWEHDESDAEKADKEQASLRALPPSDQPLPDDTLQKVPQ